MKAEITKSVLGMALGLSVFGVMPSTTQAQSSRSQTQAIADEQKRTGITTFYYAHKSNAVGKLNAEQRRGKYARMYYSDARRQWAVDVSNGLANNDSNNNSGVGNGGSGVGNRGGGGGTRVESVADEQKRTGITTFYYAHKSNATGKLNAEQRRGKYARMYYSDARRQWAVDVGNGLANGGSSGGGTSASTNPNWSADGGNLPNGASIIYFPTKASAEGIYKASLRQGDWAKMWYDTRRKEWAVAVKPR